MDTVFDTTPLRSVEAGPDTEFVETSSMHREPSTGMAGGKAPLLHTHARILRFFIKLQTTLRLYHWTTLSYSRHLASDKLDAALLPLVDDFVETYMAIHDRPPKSLTKISVKCSILSDDRMKAYLLRKRSELLKMKLPSKDLESIRDDIAGALNKTLYLFDTI